MAPTATTIVIATPDTTLAIELNTETPRRMLATIDTTQTHGKSGHSRCFSSIPPPDEQDVGQYGRDDRQRPHHHRKPVGVLLKRYSADIHAEQACDEIDRQ